MTNQTTQLRREIYVRRIAKHAMAVGMDDGIDAVEKLDRVEGMVSGFLDLWPDDGDDEKLSANQPVPKIDLAAEIKSGLIAMNRIAAKDTAGAVVLGSVNRIAMAKADEVVP
jgi:hypothetical protein